MVREPRTLLSEMGRELPRGRDPRVGLLCGGALSCPARAPARTDPDESELAGRVTRDSMIGVERL